MKYSKLAEVYGQLEKTSKRIKKTFILTNFIKEVSNEDIQHITYLLQGSVFPKQDERKIGFSSMLMIKAISTSTGVSKDKVEQKWKGLGGLGLVAEDLVKDKKQTTLFSSQLTTKKVFDNIASLATLTGEGTVNKKVSLVSELLTSSSPIEAKYIVRTILEQLRVGIAEGVLRDALVWTFFPKLEEIHSEEYDQLKKGKTLTVNSLKELKNFEDYDIIKTPDEKSGREIYSHFVDLVQEAYDLCTDFGVVAKTLKTRHINGLKEISMRLFNPVNPMLSTAVSTIHGAFEALGRTVQIEQKLDGFRVQIHKDNNKIVLYSRRLDDITAQFKELLPVLERCIKAKNFIIDTEVVGYDPKTGKKLPFQNISQRIKRKYDIERVAKEIPVEINVFDIIYYNGKNLINKPLKERRKILEMIVKQKPNNIALTKKLVTDNEDEAEKFYKDSLSNGFEGIVAKNIESPYKPGRYIGYMCKLKSILEPLDLVIVGADYGTGKRVGFLSSFIVACKDKDELLECGMVSTGLKEKSEEGVTIQEINRLLKPLIIEHKGRSIKIKPKIVIEVGYEEIQKSPTYSSSYALRFPRILRLRTEEKTVKNINTLEDVKRIFKGQKKK